MTDALDTEGDTLPIESIKGEFLRKLDEAPVVVTAPTGSGKSTQVPRWCGAHGRVLVIEPRRVACRGLAMRVAQLEQTALGGRVGYAVRDDNRTSAKTRILFATPGVVLRWIAGDGLGDFNTVILDEFHERSLDVDLLLALVQARFRGGSVVMSATMEADRIARHLGGVHLEAAGRMYPVSTRYLSDRAFLPEVRGLEDRVLAAVEQARNEPGDILVFLPGKGEIAKAGSRLAHRRDLAILPVHGGLSLDEQARIFAPQDKRRVILATNIAETSLTVPGVGVVIDSGLVRRTRYRGGRGFLTLSPIAMDSAEQRAGRAGRTAAGICCRLWSKEAILAPSTPPEIHRESLVPLVLAAASCGERVEDLPFMDPPRPFAVQAAVTDLAAVGAVDSDGGAMPTGEELFRLPLDAPLGALLLAAKKTGLLDPMIDLVSALSVGRQIFRGAERPREQKDDLRASGCDAIACIRAVQEGDPEAHSLNRFSLQEARATRKRLRSRFGLGRQSVNWDQVDRRLLALTALQSDERMAHVVRRRKKRVVWSNGGTEIQLSRESAVNPDKTDYLVVLETRALGLDARKTSILVTCAMPVPGKWLVAAKIGTPEVLGATIEKGVAMARIGRVFAGKTLAETEEVPTGPLAEATFATLFLQGRLFRASLEETSQRLAAARLHRRLKAAGLAPEHLEGLESPWSDEVPSPKAWVAARVQAIGVESGRDLPLLAADDFLAPEMPAMIRDWMDRAYPRYIDLGDAQYEVTYDLGGRKVTLNQKAGGRNSPPTLSFLPSFQGFGIQVKRHSKTWVLR